MGRQRRSGAEKSEEGRITVISGYSNNIC